MADMQEIFENGFTEKSLRDLFFGIEFLKVSDGYIYPYRLTESQLKRYKKMPKCPFPRTCAGIKAAFSTDAEKISFEYIRSKFWVYYEGNVPKFEIWVDGSFFGEFEIDISEDTSKGEVVFLVGKPNVSKNIEIYFPHNAEIGVKNLKFGNFVPLARREKRLLVMGDSISQGLMGNTSSFCYTEQLANFFDMEILNKSVGGDCFDYTAIERGSFEPTHVLTALGTNDVAFAESAEDFARIDLNIRKYLEKALEVYKGAEFALVTAPYHLSWCVGDDFRRGLLMNVREAAERHARELGIFVIDGFSMVPHTKKFYADDAHPNDAGFERYAFNIIKALAGKW